MPVKSKKLQDNYDGLSAVAVHLEVIIDVCA